MSKDKNSAQYKNRSLSTGILRLPQPLEPVFCVDYLFIFPFALKQYITLSLNYLSSAVDMKFLSDLENRLRALENRLRFYADRIVCDPSPEELKALEGPPR